MVRVSYRGSSWQVEPGSTVRHIMEEAGLNPHSLLALRDGKLISQETLAQDGDSIKLITVVSGG